MLPLLTRLLFPDTPCLLCGVHPATADGPCAACLQDMPWQLRACRTCGMPLPEEDAACACDPAEWPFSGVVCALKLEFPVDRMIYRFKELPDHTLSAPLARWILRAQRTAGLARPAALLPVPAAPERVARRGFDQAAELTRELARLSGIPCLPEAIQRQSGGEAQKNLTRKQREHNLARVFRLSAQTPFPARVALVDDVVTTGATARQLALLLRRRGVDDIQLWGVARTPRRAGEA